MEYGFILLGYLLGSIPFGLVLTRLAGYGDIRNIGSGNIGATNVLRTGNKPLALATLILDSMKGAAAVWLAFYAADSFIILVTGLMAVLGHMFPVWLNFKGGKGVATTIGTMLAVMPALGLMMILIWLAVALVSRISSLAALTAFALAPVLSFFVFGDARLAIFSATIAALVFWRHEENIKRLLKGTEPKIGTKKKKDSDEQPAGSSE